MKTDEIGADLDINVDFNIIGNETAVTFRFTSIKPLLNLTYSNFILYPHINSIKFGKI